MSIIMEEVSLTKFQNIKDADYVLSYSEHGMLWSVMVQWANDRIECQEQGDWVALGLRDRPYVIHTAVEVEDFVSFNAHEALHAAIAIGDTASQANRQTGTTEESVNEPVHPAWNNPNLFANSSAAVWAD